MELQNQFAVIPNHHFRFDDVDLENLLRIDGTCSFCSQSALQREDGSPGVSSLKLRDRRRDPLPCPSAGSTDWEEKRSAQR